MIRLSVDDLLRKAEGLEHRAISGESESVQTKEEAFEKYKNIVCGVARKYRSKWVDTEDLEQVLWIKVLEMLEYVDNDISKLNQNQVAKACFRKAVDYYRYCRLRYDRNIRVLNVGEIESVLERFSEDDTTDNIECRIDLYEKNMNQEEYVIMKEIIDLFEKGSKEQRYIKMRLYNSGLLLQYDSEEVELPGEPKAPRNTDDKIDFLAMIGYNNRRISGSWIRKENEMKRIIGEYLGHNI